MTNDYIPMDQCVPRHAYEIKSRNLIVGVYDGNEGFVGIREKMGSEYLFTEYHWDQGPLFGTVHPIKDLGQVWDGDLRDYLETRCSSCGQMSTYVEWLEGEEGNGFSGRWCHINEAGEVIDVDCEKIRPSAIHNTDLFQWLQEIEVPILEQHRLDREREEREM